MKQVLFLQGGGTGAHEEDSKLAASLQRMLGPGYVVSYPTMPHEDSPDYDVWKPRIRKEISRLDGDIILVGHSVGAYFLVKFLCEEGIPRQPIGLFLIAVPYPWGDKNWQFEGFCLPPNFGTTLANDLKIFLYHSPDDQTVPFAHVRLYAKEIPGATVRETRGGHQLDNDLSLVATDIRSL